MLLMATLLTSSLHSVSAFQAVAFRRSAASLTASSAPASTTTYNKLRETTTALSMAEGGFFDKMKDKLNFFDDRDGDFVKLEDTKQDYGPGPLVVLYNVPAGVTNDEIQDMMADGAPKAFKKGVVLYRVVETNTVDVDSSISDVLDKSMEDALEGIASGSYKDNYHGSSSSSSTDEDTAFPKVIGQEPPVVVLLFSGFANDEMLAAYNILGSEIYQESQLDAACAKAVPNAMEKPLRQVLEEVGDDHRDATSMSNKMVEQ